MGVVPVIECAVSHRLTVPDEYAPLAVPLGTITKMDGCVAIYPTIVAIFVSQFYGVPSDFTDYLFVVSVSIIGPAAATGTTGTTVMLTLALLASSPPLTGVDLPLAVELVMDMGCTAMNVTGQAVVPLVVARRAGAWDEDEWNVSTNAGLSSVDESVDTSAEKSTSAALAQS